MKKNQFVLLICIVLLSSCRNSNNSGNFRDSIDKKISLNAKGDTEFVLLQHSNIRLFVHYYQNKPKGFLLQDYGMSDSLKSHYAKSYKGVFVSINPESGRINSIGYRYLQKDEAGEMSVSDSGTIDSFTRWEQYNNNGKVYDVKQTDKGEIVVYTLRNGEKIDSSVYERKGNVSQ